MYKCEDCNCVFEEPEKRRHINRSGEELDPPSFHCPQCKSEFFHVIEHCIVCDQMKDFRVMNGDVCDDCLADIEVRIKNIIYRNFSVLEVDAARKHLEIGGIL